MSFDRSDPSDNTFNNLEKSLNQLLKTWGKVCTPFEPNWFYPLEHTNLIEFKILQIEVERGLWEYVYRDIRKVLLNEL